jgi:hypothetical protein
MHYRALARQALQKAKLELDSGDPDRLEYAALQLRKALEAVTYERAQLYGTESPGIDYRTWQPPQAIKKWRKSTK